MKKLLNNHGFTVTELIIVIVVIGILFAITLPNFIKAKDKARESEVKSNIHKIQIALERYAVDHRHYPAMIWGGDRKGWSTEKGVGCRTMWEHEEYDPVKDNNKTARPPFDPLIYYGFLESYPRNPFMNEGDGLVTTIKWTNPRNPKPGNGDPRFGFNGELMGNIIEDPRYLWYLNDKKQPRTTRIANCFCEGVVGYNSGMISNRLPANPFYAMGGIPEWERFTEDVNAKGPFSNLESEKWIKAWWPGEFFYRSFGSFILTEEFLDTSKANPELYRIWDFQFKELYGYTLGGFGSMRTDGYDLIRLVDLNGSAIDNLTGYGPSFGYYEPHPDYPRTQETPIRFSSPEVFGGGGRDRMPYFPYTDPETGYCIFGAPDGFPDGVIIAVTSSGPNGG